MEGAGAIAVFLGGLALFVGFCGLWLASFALRKIDSQIDVFLKGPVKGLRDGLGEVNDRLTATQTELDHLKKQSKEALTNLHRDMELHRTNIAQIHRNLVDLTEKVQQLAAAAAALQPRHALQRQADPPFPTKQAG